MVGRKDPDSALAAEPGEGCPYPVTRVTWGQLLHSVAVEEMAAIGGERATVLLARK
jgi:hypothetical protein